MDPRERFTGLADVYAANRPDYPAAAFDFLIARCGLSADSLVADVGCGTGISTRQLAARGIPTLGIEPNNDMRGKAQAFGGVEIRAGTAEATGLEDASVDAVLSAQAFHWFSPDPTLREFHRILKQGGWIMLIWNERDERDPITRGYGDALRRAPETIACEEARQRAAEPLWASTLYADQDKRVFAHEQHLDEEGLVARAMSASYFPKDDEGRGVLAAELRALYHGHAEEGSVALHYVTTVHVARKAG